MRHSFYRVRQSLIAALEIGTHKTCCWIAKREESGLRVVGVGHQATRGYYAGRVKDMVALESTIVSAVHEAEKVSGETIRHVFVSVNGPALQSSLRVAKIPLLGQVVTKEDLKRLFLEARLQKDHKDFLTIHALPLEYALDAEKGIENPCGMLGTTLKGTFHVVQTPSGMLKNFLLAIEKSHLDLLALAASPYVTGLSVLTEDERTLGTTIVDMGASGTSVGVFWGGQLVHADFIPIGGQHVTLDLAHGLETSTYDAERLKVLYGSCFLTPKDHQEMIQVPLLGDRTQTHNPVSRSLLVDIIQPRIEEIFLHVWQILQKTGLETLGSQRVVLTGGGSQLPGLREMLQTRLGRQVRLGKPHFFSDVSGGDRPEFSTISGLLLYAESDEFKHTQNFFGKKRTNLPFFRQMASWFKENL